MKVTLPDLAPIFVRYETLAAEADILFERVRAAHPDCVTCHEGCSDCCHALFDLTLVEAAYINHSFAKYFSSGLERSGILEAASAADRKVHTIKRRAFKASKSGTDTDNIIMELGKERIRCPLLNDGNKCALYAHRPITCRLYGIPTAIGGKGYTCGKSAFTPGKQYPTVNIDAINQRLLALSLEMAQCIESPYKEIHTVLVPLSMALITTYDATYFGLGKQELGARNV